jgi:hypothetical protein
MHPVVCLNASLSHRKAMQRRRALRKEEAGGIWVYHCWERLHRRLPEGRRSPWRGSSNAFVSSRVQINGEDREVLEPTRDRGLMGKMDDAAVGDDAVEGRCLVNRRVELVATNRSFSTGCKLR